jgi:hypothetical protein
MTTHYVVVVVLVEGGVEVRVGVGSDGGHVVSASKMLACDDNAC